MQVRDGDAEADGDGDGDGLGELAAPVSDGVFVFVTPITGVTVCEAACRGAGELLSGTAAAGGMYGKCGLEL